MRSRQGHLALSAATGIVAASLLAGCVGGGAGNAPGDGATGGPVTLDFPNFQASEVPFSAWWDQFIPAYEAKYPNVKVQVSKVANSAALAETLVTRFAANNPPGVVGETTANFASFANADRFIALDDILKGTRVPEVWGPLQKDYTWNGKTEGVMTLSSGIFLFYNEKLLKDAGVAVPTTPEELVAAAKAVYNPSKGIYGFDGCSASQDTKLYNEPSAFVVGGGGQWYKDGKPNFTDPAVLKGLEFYREAMATAPPGIQHTQRNTIFQNGQAAFMLENANFIGAIKATTPADILPSLKAAPAPFAQEPGLGSVFLAVPKGLDAATQKAAEDFVLYAVSPEQQKKYAEIVGAPAPDPESISSLIGKDPQMAMFAEQSSKAISMYPVDPAVLQKMPILNKFMFDAMVEVSSSARPIGEIMSALQTQAESALK